MKQAPQILPPNRYLCRSFTVPGRLTPKDARAYLEDRVETYFPITGRDQSPAAYVWDAVVVPTNSRRLIEKGLIYLVDGNNEHNAFSIPFFLACLSQGGWKAGRYFCKSDQTWEIVTLSGNRLDYQRYNAPDRPTEDRYKQEKQAENVPLYLYAYSESVREKLGDSRAKLVTAGAALRKAKNLSLKNLSRATSSVERILWIASGFLFSAFLLAFPAFALDRQFNSILRTGAEAIDTLQRELGTADAHTRQEEELRDNLERLRLNYPLPVFSTANYLLSALAPRDLIRNIQIQNREITFSVQTRSPFGVLERLQRSPAFSSFSIEQISRVDETLSLVRYQGVWSP